MPEKMILNSEGSHQEEIVDKNQEEKTTEVLDVVNSQGTEREIVLTPEQEKLKNELVKKLKNDNSELKDFEYFFPFKEIIKSDDVQRAAESRYSIEMKFGDKKTAYKIKEHFFLSKEFVQEIEKEVIRSCFAYNRLDETFEKIENIFSNVCSQESIKQVAKEFFEKSILTITDHSGLSLLYSNQDDIFNSAIKIKEKFSLPEEFIQQIIKKGFVELITGGYIDYATNIKEKFSLPEEFIQSDEVKKVIKEVIIKASINGQTDDIVEIKEKFNISEKIIQQIVKDGIIICLSRNQLDTAFKIKDKFNISITSQEVINTNLKVQTFLLQLKEISPEFYDQALKSVDIIILLFPLAKDPEQVIKTIKENHFLVKAVSENPRFGSKLLVKYPEFDETSQENIKFMYNAKKEILEENPEMDPESADFRIAMQEKLKTYKNNLEILQEIESMGIDTDQWLNYSETEYFSLDSGNSKIAFSETVATPINRIKETIASYAYKVKEVIKEYQKELQEHKIQTGNADETSEMIKKMESELARAKEEGNEKKINGLEKGIASYQEKMKKGKEIPLWNKVIGDINSFDRLKNDVFKSHENVIKAEKEFKEYAKDKSRATMDLMEAKRIFAKAKEDLKEKFGLLEKRIEDFRNNLVSVLESALGKDRSEALLQEIQQGLGEQFDHYDSDRSTLANFFSEKSDKEKEKLDSRPMSIFVWARNPDVDLYQGNYNDCCIKINSEHMGAESTIADYNTDLGIQIVNIWDETKNEPITAAWCWIGKDNDGNIALVVDNIESNTLYSSNYPEQLADKLFAYLKNYAKSIGVKKIIQGKANNDLPVASQLAKMDSDKGEYLKVGGYNRENGYFLEAKETGTKIIWEEKEKKKKKREKSEKAKVEFKNREFRSLTEEDLEDILKLEETTYANDYLNQGEELVEDIESGKGFDYSVVLMGEKEAGKKEIIGYTIGVEDETDEGKPSIYLEDIVIAPEAQGQGLGWEIMQKMIEKLKEKAAEENKTILFDMHLRESSQRLMEKHKEDLERLGLKLVDEALVPDYYDEGEDALYRVYEIRK